MPVILHSPAEGKQPGETYTGEREAWLVANGYARWDGAEPENVKLLLANDPTNPANREKPDSYKPANTAVNAQQDRADINSTAGNPSVLRGTPADSEFGQADASQARPTGDSQAAFLTDRRDPNVNPHEDDASVADRPNLTRQADADAAAEIAKEEAAQEPTGDEAADGTETPEEGPQD